MKPHYAECGCCGYWHLATYSGDCRNDAERFTLDHLDAIHPGGYTIEGEDDVGYTHYWTQTRDFTQDEMLQIGEGVRAIIATASGRAYPSRDSDEPSGSLVIAGGAGERASLPQIDDKTISFNGLGPDLDHETFVFCATRELPYPSAEPDRLGWAFCKTARKPYDVVVTATLTFLSKDWGFEVGSDGGVEDWDLGVKLAEEALGREFPNPLIVEQLVG